MNNNKNNYKYCKKTNFAKQITCFTFSFATGICIVDDAMSESRMIPFVPDNFTGLDAMDRQTATKIDSGLVSATLNMNMNNQIPFGGNLLMYISNSPDYFPLCIDSLFTSDIDNQIIDSTCKADIQNYYW